MPPTMNLQLTQELFSLFKWRYKLLFLVYIFLHSSIGFLKANESPLIKKNRAKIVIDCSFDLGPDVEFCSPYFELAGPATTTCTNNNAITYQWTKDGLPFSNYQGIIVSSLGTYCLTYTDCNGCSYTDCISYTECVTGSPSANTGFATCVLEPDWCRHQVTTTNNSCCEAITVWCEEVGCSGDWYDMCVLNPGESCSVAPSAYDAIFHLYVNGVSVHEFPQLPADGTCRNFNFEYNPTSGTCACTNEPTPNIPDPCLSTTVTASSALGALATWAFDGNMDGNYNNLSVFHSDTETNPWWQVDYGHNRIVKQIEIWNRTDCCSDRLNGAIVEILNAANAVQFTYTIGTATTQNIISVGDISGQKVRVRLQGTNKILQLAEVKITTEEIAPEASVGHPTCNNGVSNANGFLQLSSGNGGDRYAFSRGNTFTGNPSYDNAIDISSATYPIQFNTGLSNADAGDYTIRVFYGANDCFTDVVVTVIAAECTLDCSNVPSLTCAYRLQKQVDWVSGNCNPTICADGRLELSVIPTTFTTYDWSGPNGFSRTGNANGDILISNCLMPEQAGTYTVTVTDENGCTGTTAITVTTKECPCNLNATVSNETYLDNNTSNTDQHTFTYDLAIDGSGQNGWLMYDVVSGNINQIIDSGDNNTTLNMGPFPVDQNGSMLILMDADNTACIQSIGVNMNSCVYTGACDCCR